MKTMILNVLAVFTVIFTMSCDKEEIVQENDLPTSATTFLSTYFKNINVTQVQKEKEGFGSSEYNVYLSDGTEITFDKNGNWKEVDGPGKNPIPTGFIPEPIVKYVNDNYPSTPITSIEKNSRTYDVELTNDLDLIFNSDGVFQRIDR